MNVHVVPRHTTDFIHALYRLVDARNAEALGEFLTENATFQLGNFEPITGRRAVIDANAAFFTTVAGMTHAIEGIWEQGETVICAGYVQYKRLDSSELSIPFSTILRMERNRIADYQVYVDTSPL